MRTPPMEHNTDVNPHSGLDHDSYLQSIGYKEAMQMWSRQVAMINSYVATWPKNDLYRQQMPRMKGRERYWRNKLDTIIREHSCHKCNRWTGTHYLHADNMWSSQQAKPEYVCDHCLANH
jgi:hypothetical protein